MGVAYTALANADLTIAVEGCTVAPLDPKAAVTVLYKDELENGTNIAADTAKLAARYAADVCSAAAAVEAGLADMAVPAARRARRRCIRSGYAFHQTHPASAEETRQHVSVIEIVKIINRRISHENFQYHRKRHRL